MKELLGLGQAVQPRRPAEEAFPASQAAAVRAMMSCVVNLSGLPYDALALDPSVSKVAKRPRPSAGGGGRKVELPSGSGVQQRPQSLSGVGSRPAPKPGPSFRLEEESLDSVASVDVHQETGPEPSGVQPEPLPGGSSPERPSPPGVFPDNDGEGEDGGSLVIDLADSHGQEEEEVVAPGGAPPRLAERERKTDALARTREFVPEELTPPGVVLQEEMEISVNSLDPAGLEVTGSPFPERLDGVAGVVDPLAGPASLSYIESPTLAISGGAGLMPLKEPEAPQGLGEKSAEGVAEKEAAAGAVEEVEETLASPLALPGVVLDEDRLQSLWDVYLNAAREETFIVVKEDNRSYEDFECKLPLGPFQEFFGAYPEEEGGETRSLAYSRQVLQGGQYFIAGKSVLVLFFSFVFPVGWLRSKLGCFC